MGPALESVKKQSAQQTRPEDKCAVFEKSFVTGLVLHLESGNVGVQMDITIPQTNHHS
jgi:putative Mn2+ efflux pump MntP